MSVAACAVGRLGDSEDWIGFAPSIEDRYDLVIGHRQAVLVAATAQADDLLAHEVQALGG